jgi:excisionase family DNA binding protein
MIEVNERMYSVADVAKIWSVHRETVLRWIRQGRMTCIDIGTDRPVYRFTKEMAHTPPGKLIK